jgi:enoyl-CoA hydratase
MQALRIDIADHVATVTLMGPGKGNAMGPDFWRELPVAMAELDDNDDVHVVVVRGQGPNFSFGLDLMGMVAELAPVLMGNPDAAARAKLLEVIRRMQGSISSAATCKKPVIAAVRGWCIGGGLDLVAACDVRVASTTAQFSLREVKLAMVADVGSLQRLPHIIGDAATRELALTGKDIGAARAQALGLVSDVIDDAAFDDAVATLAKTIAANPPLVVQGVKQVMNRRIADEIERGLQHVATWNAAFLPSEDLQEAIAAFSERRPPVFRGR